MAWLIIWTQMAQNMLPGTTPQGQEIFDILLDSNYNYRYNELFFRKIRARALDFKPYSKLPKTSF